MTSPSTPQVIDNADRDRFELVLDGQVAGYAEYHRHRDSLALTHTVVEEAFAGRGLAGVLARAALDSARERGLTVLPYCPYIRSWMTKHPEYLDLVPTERRDEFNLVPPAPSAS